MNSTKIEAIIKTWLFKHTKKEIEDHLTLKWLAYELTTAEYEKAVSILNGIA